MTCYNDFDEHTPYQKAYVSTASQLDAYLEQLEKEKQQKYQEKQNKKNK